MSNKDTKIYVNYNFNRNQVKDVIIDNNLESNFVDIWLYNTYYEASTIIYNSSDGKFYDCTTTHTSSSNFINDISNWTLISNTTDLRKKPNINNGGLIYFDIHLKRLKVWDGTQFKILKYLDDIDKPNTENIQMESIWVDSEIIPNVTTLADNSNILYKHNNATTSYISNSYGFKIGKSSAATHSTTYYGNGEKRLAINSIIPDHYGATAFYKPVLKTYNGVVIPEGFNNWKLLDDSIIFYNGFSNSGSIIVNENYPPTISFYEYIGRRLSVTYNGNSSNTQIYQILGINGSINGNDFILPIIGGITNINQIKSIFINGLLIYNAYIVSGFNEITINMLTIGYIIEPDDFIYVEIN